MLEIGQPNHQACRLRWPAERAVEATKLLIEAVPVDESGKPKQLVTLIEDLIETAAVEIAGTRHRRLGSHSKTPAFGGSVPRNRHFTMLREDEESFNLNKLWVVQGRLLYTSNEVLIRQSDVMSYRIGGVHGCQPTGEAGNLLDGS
jgi:hypothetical protein